LDRDNTTISHQLLIKDFGQQCIAYSEQAILTGFTPKVVELLNCWL